MNLALASRLRQQIEELRSERARLEYRLLKRRRMLRASFVGRYLSTGDGKRKTPAYYLSFLREGRTVQKYVRLGSVAKVRPRTEAWGEYYHLLAQWVKLNQQLADVWRALGEAEADEPEVAENG
jgi:hypothetical protein